MIPKTIHYCWFGHGKKPKLAQKCIASWKKYCPDYEIIEWNEDNFDVNMNGYTKMCYEQKKYAFLSDYARLLIVEKYGGIYFDTDVELLKSPNDLIQYGAFFGFETHEYVASGLGFGSEQNGPVIRAMLDEYKPLLDGTNGTRGCPRLNTAALIKLGLLQNGSMQIVGNAMILPCDYLNPYESATGHLRKTSHTISIHWYAASWMSPWQRLRSFIARPFHKLFGINCFRGNTKNG